MNHHKCNKPDHFLEFYDKNLPINPKAILEIGVQTGRSLLMWKDAYPNAKIYGMDIYPPSEKLPKGITFVLGDQTDKKLLDMLPYFDIIIDDGSHMTSHQQFTFKYLFPSLNAGGMYIIEDTETSYQDQYCDSPLTTVQYIASLMDDVHDQKSIKSITVIKDLVAIEKL